MATLAPRSGPVIALSGGIGGAKLALGLSRIVEAEDLVVVANTGDDFEHLGLSVSPDLDTLMYTLGGLDNPNLGWGRRDETWSFMSALEALGGETWFRLGDGDLATHIERSRRLAEGATLTEVTGNFCRRLGVPATILPMTDDSVRTIVQTTDGERSFQSYFVRDRCQPVVRGFRFDGVGEAHRNPALLVHLESRMPRAIVICPSNPYISVDPILAVPGLRDDLARTGAPVVAVSPVIGGDAVKGPTAKMMRELGHPSTASEVAKHYGPLLDGFVLDDADAGECDAISVPCFTTRTLMTDEESKVTLAREVLEFARKLGK